MKCSKFAMTALGLGLMLMLAGAQAADDAVKVKVHKDHIRLQANGGVVHITGGPGAIEATAAVRAYLRHEDTKEKVSFDVAMDGGFHAVITAQAGEKLRVYAHAGDKTSYGTFTVPQASPQPPAIIPAPPASPSVPAETPREQLPISPEVELSQAELLDIEALGLDPVKLRRELIKAHQENIHLRRELQRVWLQLEQLQESLQRHLPESTPENSTAATTY